MGLASAVCSSLIISCNFSKDIPVETTKVAVNKLFAGRTCLQVSSVSQEPLVRRSGNYKPCLWDYNFLQSLNTVYRGESFNALVSELKEDVKLMFKNVVEPLDQLELIDHLQKLAIGYHFDEEIKSCLKNIYDYDHDQTNSNEKWENNLHATALKFRLLREHGYFISSEVFDGFTENQRFKDCISKDLKGILSLYEASYYSIEGELLMEEACSFTSTILKEHVEHIDDLDLGTQVKHALELPLQWKIPRLEAKWYIDIYERNTKMIPSVLKLAKLDFNIVQGSSQEELIEVSRWWNTTGLGEKLDFIRDRLASSFLWSVGISCKPQHAYFRIQMTKVIQFVSIVDDIYDVYGTLDELELFTSVIQRWDITAALQLPYYMKICFMSLHNLVNDIAYDILKEQNIDVLPHLRKSWTDLVKCYIVEARWFHGGYKPTFNEFLSNGLVTFGGPMAVLHFYILTSNLIRKEAIQLIEDLPDIARLASEICRLADDYGTSSEELERGDIPKSIQCYMMGRGVSEQIARKHMIEMMRKKWQKMMKSRYYSPDELIPLDWSEVENMLLNLVRVTHCTYNSGNDGFGVEGGKTKERMFSLFIEPIPVPVILQDRIQQ